jgi:hypothetical protein
MTDTTSIDAVRFELPEPGIITTYRYELPDGPVVDGMWTGADGRAKKVAVRTVVIELDEQTGDLDITVRGIKLLKNGQPDKRQTYYENADWATHEGYKQAWLTRRDADRG